MYQGMAFDLGNVAVVRDFEPGTVPEDFIARNSGAGVAFEDVDLDQLMGDVELRP